MIGRIVSRVSSLLPGGKTKRLSKELKTQRHHFGSSEILQTIPESFVEHGALLDKENWIVQNLADPDHFNHFLAHIYHPQKADSHRPVLILLPGILCNGNLFRLARFDGNFRNLDQAGSFANDLANAGYHVVIVNPRYARWIYTRYVKGKLKVKNYFSDAVDFGRLSNDIPFFTDVATGFTKAQRAVVIGYSMGGMEFLYFLSQGKIPPTLVGGVFLATGGKFSSQQLLIRRTRHYNRAAKLIPLGDYSALKLAARNVVPFKPILRRIPPSLLQEIDMVGEICNFSNMDPGTVQSTLTYVLEPITSPIVDYFQDLAQQGNFVSPDRKIKILEELANVSLPSLFVAGSEDRVVTSESSRQAFNHFGGPRKELVTIAGAGHLDLVTGLNSRETVERVLGFLRFTFK